MTEPYCDRTDAIKLLFLWQHGFVLFTVLRCSFLGVNGWILVGKDILVWSVAADGMSPYGLFKIE